MFQKERVKSEALNMMAWGGDDAAMRALRNVDVCRREGDAEREKYWALIFDRIREIEFPIDDEWG